MTQFVSFLGGAWLGAWAWKEVTPQARESWSCCSSRYVDWNGRAGPPCHQGHRHGHPHARRPECGSR